MKFLCDEMLGKLGRWLRAAGYDVVIAGTGSRDRDLLERALAEGRMLLTRDRSIIEMRGARACVVVLDGEGLDRLAKEISDRLSVDWLHEPFSRCMVCNTPLVDANEEALSALPWNGRGCHAPLRHCPTCDRLYWQGSHVDRMRQRLSVFASRKKGAEEERPA